MDAERLRRINALLEVVLELPEPQREGWLRTLPVDQQPLAPLIAAMLARTGVETNTFMRQPIAMDMEELGGMLAPPDKAGDAVGPWRLLRELGAGGMATVWLAERSDGAMQRQVALKLPLAGWSPGHAQRMRRERDILAALAHRGIARLYDAGTTDEGRPWLAMECVEGVAIDVYCREQALDVRQRLRLFQQVAQAVAHAHARLVVHRDLKPTNILVGTDGSVCLLDFGVAKLLVDDAAADAGLTRLLGVAVTPDYASPEQVSKRAITVATDVYSLGVVLYELLTETRPYRLERQSMAALEEAILNAESPLASSRVGGMLARQLRGDLDNILDKALQKDPALRYCSVESMASDVQRYLDGEAVLARPRGRIYRAGKFLARHRWGVTAVTSVVLASLGGTAVALWHAHEAGRQEAIARRSLNIAEASSEFSQEVMTEGLQRDESGALNRLVDRTVATAERSFGGNGTLSAVAVDAASSWLMSASRVADAEKLLAHALQTFAPDFQPGFVGYLRCKHGEALVGLGRHTEGVLALQTGLAANLGPEGAGAYCLQGLATAAMQANDPQAALDYMLSAQRAFANEHRQSPSAHAYLLSGLGRALILNGRTEEADATFGRALELLSNARRGASGLAFSIRNGWGVLKANHGDPRGALEQFETIVDGYIKSSAPGAMAISVYSNQIAALNILGRYKDASRMALTLLQQTRESGNHLYELRALAGQGLALAAEGQFAKARSVFDEGAEVMRLREVSPTHSAGMLFRLMQAMALQWEGRLPESHNAFMTLSRDFESLGLRTASAAYALAGCSETALALGQAQAAQGWAEKALALAEQLQGKRAHSLATGHAWLALAQAQQALGAIEPARKSAAKASELLEASVQSEHRLSRQAQRLEQSLDR